MLQVNAYLIYSKSILDLESRIQILFIAHPIFFPFPLTLVKAGSSGPQAS